MSASENAIIGFVMLIVGWMLGRAHERQRMIEKAIDFAGIQRWLKKRKHDEKATESDIAEV